MADEFVCCHDAVLSACFCSLSACFLAPAPCCSLSADSASCNDPHLLCLSDRAHLVIIGSSLRTASAPLRSSAGSSLCTRCCSEKKMEPFQLLVLLSVSCLINAAFCLRGWTSLPICFLPQPKPASHLLFWMKLLPSHRTSPAPPFQFVFIQHCFSA